MEQMLAVTLIVNWITVMLTGAIITKTEYVDHKEWQARLIFRLFFLSLVIICLSLFIPVAIIGYSLIG